MGAWDQIMFRRSRSWRHRRTALIAFFTPRPLRSLCPVVCRTSSRMLGGKWLRGHGIIGRLIKQWPGFRVTFIHHLSYWKPIRDHDLDNVACISEHTLADESNTHCSRQLWGTGAPGSQLPTTKFFQLTLEPHKVYIKSFGLVSCPRKALYHA